MKKVLLLLISFLVIFSVPAYAKTETFDIFTYTAPAGWKKDTSSQGTVTYTKIKNNKYCTIGVYKSRQSSGNPQQDFDTEWNELVAKPFGIGAGSVLKESKDSGWDILLRGDKAQVEGSGEFSVSLTSFSGHGRVSSVIVTCNDDSFTKDIETFFNSFDTVKDLDKNNNIAANDPPQGANPNLKGNDVVGVWMGHERGVFVPKVSYNPITKTTTYTSSYDATSVRLSWKIFFADGTYYSTMPTKGLNDPEFEANYLGTYTLSKGVVRAKLNQFPNSDADVYSMDSPTSMQFRKLPFKKCKSVDDLKLDARYQSATQTKAYYDSTAQSTPTITFSRNGTFVDDNFIGTYISERYAGGSGTYQIKNFSLILRYNDGRMMTTALVVPPGKDASNSLYIGFTETMRY